MEIEKFQRIAFAPLRNLLSLTRVTAWWHCTTSLFLRYLFPRDRLLTKNNGSQAPPSKGGF